MNYTTTTESFDEVEGHRYHVTTKCPECKGTEVITIPGPALFEYNQGAGPIQRLFPDLTANQRERLFMSGICGTCWDAMFADEG